MDSMGYLLVPHSQNKQTGPIPVSYAPKKTCPITCKLIDECYAKKGHVHIHWDAADTDKYSTVVPFDRFCEKIVRLPNDQLWRHCVAGDTPPEQLEPLVGANKGKRGFSYTAWRHANSTHHWAKANGFTLNRSCYSVKEAVASARAGVHSVLSGLAPSKITENTWKVDGIGFVVCPHKRKEPDAKSNNCSNCGLCYQRPSNIVIVFPLH
jgi:hypothetical protein